MTKKINGTLFEQLIRNGLNNLQLNEKQVNDLNVFPVPDGDTGTNMRLTLANGIQSAESTEKLNEYLQQLCRGMLFGARGNSGVILSQLFKGFSEALARRESADARDLKEAFIRGYKRAYAAVVRPVEGTMLTVAREGAEGIRAQVDDNTGVENFFAMYLAEMRKSLSYTPQILPVLKEAGVVDSGGLGLTLIVDGMLKYLYGEKLDEKAPQEEQIPFEPQSEFFHEDSVFRFGYCMEFILQLLNEKSPVGRFREEEYTEDLKTFGDSIVVIREGTRVKVHVHTKKPAKIIGLSQEYGEFVTFKLENMQMQHNEHVFALQQSKKKKPLAFVAVANGEGVKKLLMEEGCDYVIDGGATMNTSAQEFVNAFRMLGEGDIVVFPNNKNIIRAAMQATELCGAKNVTVLPTSNVAECFFALSADVADEPDTEKRKQHMANVLKNVSSAVVSRATRDCVLDGVTCKKGRFVAMTGGKVVCCEENYLDAARSGLACVAEGKSGCIVFLGSALAGKTAEFEALSDAFPDLQTEVTEGGQQVYDIIIGAI